MHYLRKWKGQAMDGPPKRKFLYENLKITIIDLYNIGLTARQIAKPFGLSNVNVSQFLKKENITRDRKLNQQIRQPAKSIHWRSSRASARRLYQRFHKVILSRKEHIHHIDHDFTNNDINNLMVMAARDHASYHAKVKKRKK